MKKLSKSALLLSVSALSALAGSTGLTSCSSGAYSTWTTYSTGKVVQGTYHNEDFINLGENLKIQMMRDEYESTQLIITSKSKQYFDVIKTDLVDETTGEIIPKENIDIFVQKYIEIEYNNYNASSKSFLAGDAIPDLLLPLKYAKRAKENFVEANSNQGITIEVNSNGLKAGNYKGSILLKVGSSEKEVPFEVTIWDIALEEKSAIQSCWLIYSMYMYTGEYDASEQMVDTYQDFLTRYKANPYLIQESVMNSPEALMQDVERMWDMKNFNSIIIPYDFPLNYDPDTYQGVEAAEYIVKIAEKSTEDRFLLDYALFYPSTYDEADVIGTKKAASPTFFEDGGRYDKTLEKAIQMLQAKGYFAGKTEAWNNRVKEAIRNIPDVFTNVGYVENWVKDWPAAFCPKINALDSQQNREVYQDYAKLNANGDLWTYTCCDPVYPYPSHHLDDDCLSMRVLGWIEKANNINGYLYFMANMYAMENDPSDYSSPYDHASRNNAANGDGWIMYPGRPYGSPEPFPSMRLVTYRDGLEDYEMLEVYENKIREACEKYNITDLDPREHAKDLYDSLFSNSIPTEDHHALYQAREELANRILNFENNGNYFTRTKQEDGATYLYIYTSESSLNIDGTTAYGKDIGNNNYSYKVLLRKDKKIIPITGVSGTLNYQNPGYDNLTHFDTNGATVSVSETSTFENVDGKINVTINSVKKEQTNHTIRFVPYISISGINVSDVKKLIFKYSNTSLSEDLLFNVVIETDDFTETVGGHFCITDSSKKVEVDLSNSTLNLSKVNTIKIEFANYYYDDLGELQVYSPRNMTIEDIYAMY